MIPLGLSHTGLTTIGDNLPATKKVESQVNHRKSVRLIAGDHKSQIGSSKVYGQLTGDSICAWLQTGHATHRVGHTTSRACSQILQSYD